MFASEVADLSRLQEDQPDTSDQWVNWISARIAETDKAYSFKPEFMVGHYRGEKSTAKDYAGRELLELVQNAADAAAEAGGNGRVRIEVSEQGLFVANTGKPFRTGGVRSLMTSHTSDKSDQKVRLIGAKGLGFRSLLNWSTEPFVTSGALEMAFSRSAAEEHGKHLAASDARIGRLLHNRTELQVPILAFPVVGRNLETLVDTTALALMEQARSLRSSGKYDTVVAAAFGSDASRQRALIQISEFDPHFLLFVEALSEIVLVYSGREISWSKVLTSADRFSLVISEKGLAQTQQWICKRKTGVLPNVAQKVDVDTFELGIAFRTDKPNAAGKLHCYFPTDLSLPFAALFHATLELDSHRKSLNADSEVNQAVLRELAVFFGECLEQLSTERTVKNPILFLSRSSVFPEVLREFEAAVYSDSRNRPLIPTVAGRHVSAGETSIGPIGYLQYLPRHLFGDIAQFVTDAERSTLQRLDVAELSPETILDSLRNNDLLVDERAAAVVGFAKFIPAKFHDRSLLLDASGRNLTKSNSCFPPPASGRPPVLPRWARAKFVLPELWLAIVKLMGVTPSERFRLLAGFGVHEFNTEGVVTSLRRQAAETIKNKAEPTRVKRELLQALFQIRQTVAKDSAFPAGRTEVVCQDGLWRDARTVHLSQEYGQTGRITASLFGSSTERLIGTPEANSVTGDFERVVDFFKWIGVHQWPAHEERTVPWAVHASLASELPEKFEVYDESHRQEIRRQDLSWGNTVRASQLWIVGLEQILQTAPSEAILSWLARDPRFDAQGGVTFWTKVEARSSSRSSFRPFQGVLPDLVRRAIQENAWLVTSEGVRVSPRDSMITPGGLAKLFNVPRRPTAEEEEELGLGGMIWQIGLLRAGVPNQLGDLSAGEIYRLLGSLKVKKVAPDLVRRLYAQILDLESFDPGLAPGVAAAFRRSGEIQVRTKGTIGWSSPVQALYLDRDNFPLAAREYLSLLDLPPRRSASDVQARFGVDPISKQPFSLTVGRIIEDDGAISAILRNRLSDSLPFIKALRLAHSAETHRLRTFDKLQLRVAVEVDLEFSLGSELFPGKLDCGRYVIQNDLLIIAVDPAKSPDELMLQGVTAISDGLAELFELQSGDDFEKLLWADTQNLRIMQLKRLLSNQPPDEVERLLASFDDIIAQAEQSNHIDPVTFATGIGAGDVPAQGSPAATLNASSASAIESVLPATAGGVVVSLSSTQLEVRDGTSHPQGRVDFRITTVGAFASTPNRDPHAPTDAEQWAMMFEEDEGRFPIQVSRMQGTRAFGCDCLSFTSAKDRQAFEDDPSQVSLVSRFIEVKSGVVRLTENEMKAAERHKDRYYIYRLQFEGGARGNAHLTVLSRPLSHKAALSRECEILIDRIDARLRYRLTPRFATTVGDKA